MKNHFILSKDVKDGVNFFLEWQKSQFFISILMSFYLN